MEIALGMAVNALLGVLLLALLRWRRREDGARLSGVEDALALFRHRYPDAAGRADVTEDHRGALIDLQSGGIGLLQRHGLRWNARVLEAGDLAACTLDATGSLHLKLADFGWPQAQVRLAEPATRTAWARRLTALAQAGRRPVSAARHA